MTGSRLCDWRVLWLVKRVSSSSAFKVSLEAGEIRRRFLISLLVLDDWKRETGCDRIPAKLPNRAGGDSWWDFGRHFTNLRSGDGRPISKLGAATSASRISVIRLQRSRKCYLATNQFDYSARNACIGSTEAARIAGIRLAASATATRTAMVTVNVSGSNAETP